MNATPFLLLLTAMFATGAEKQTPTQRAQAEAIRLFPELATSGSPFNQLFLKAVADAKKNGDPILSKSDWPLAVAKRVAADSGQKEVQVTNENSGGGLRKLVKLTVEQVAASPFTLEGSLVELTGIREVDIQETEAGVYEITIRGSGSGTLTATLPQRLATVAESSRTLLVSVDKPDKHRTTVIVHGNKTVYQGLSTLPTPAWQ